jgi:hypothetical protein
MSLFFRQLSKTDVENQSEHPTMKKNIRVDFSVDVHRSISYLESEKELLINIKEQP